MVRRRRADAKVIPDDVPNNCTRHREIGWWKMRGKAGCEILTAFLVNGTQTKDKKSGMPPQHIICPSGS